MVESMWPNIIFVVHSFDFYVRSWNLTAWSLSSGHYFMIVFLPVLFWHALLAACHELL